MLSKHTGDGISQGFSDSTDTSPRRRGLESLTPSINTSFFTICRAQCSQAIYKQGDNLLIDVVLGGLMRINCTLSVSSVLPERNVAIRDLLVGVNHRVYVLMFIDNRLLTYFIIILDLSFREVQSIFNKFLFFHIKSYFTTFISYTFMLTARTVSDIYGTCVKVLPIKPLSKIFCSYVGTYIGNKQGVCYQAPCLAVNW